MVLKSGSKEHKVFPKWILESLNTFRNLQIYSECYRLFAYIFQLFNNFFNYCRTIDVLKLICNRTSVHYIKDQQ